MEMRCAKCGTNNPSTHRRCAILAEIHNWFTEGFDTADLKDAKALLDELGGSAGCERRD